MRMVDEWIQTEGFIDSLIKADPESIKQDPHKYHKFKNNLINSMVSQAGSMLNRWAYNNKIKGLQRTHSILNS